MRTWSILLIVSLVLLLLLEGAAWLLVGSAPLDVRYQCAANAPEEHFTIFSYGGSTVYGTPVPEYGFMAQIDAATGQAAPDRYTVCNMGEGGRDSTGELLDIEKTIHYQPDLIIVLSGHNEFLQPVFDSTMARRWRGRIASLATIRLFNKLTAKIARRLNGPAVQQAMPAILVAHDRSGTDFKARLDRYKNNVESMVLAAQKAGIPLVFGTSPSNLDEWAPVFKKIPIGEGGVRNEQSVTQILDLVEAHQFDAARTRFDAIKWEPEEADAPIVKYLEAQFLAKHTLDQQKVRREAFLAVRDADPIPWRALTRFNDEIRTAVKGKTGVTLVDVEELLGNSADDGLPGFDLITDNCHPTPVANYLIARALLDAAVPHTGESFPWSEEDANRYMTSLPKDLRLEYLLRNGVYVMKVPFFNYTASRRYLEEARTDWPSDWRSWGNLASIELMVGDPAQGREMLHRALSLQPDQKLYTGHQHTPYLRDAMKAQGLSFEMILSDEPAAEQKKGV